MVSALAFVVTDGAFLTVPVGFGGALVTVSSFDRIVSSITLAVHTVGDRVFRALLMSRYWDAVSIDFVESVVAYTSATAPIFVGSTWVRDFASAENPNFVFRALAGSRDGVKDETIDTGL